MSNYIEAKQNKLTKEKAVNKKAKNIVELINKFKSWLFEKKKITREPKFFLERNKVEIYKINKR